MDIRNKIWNVDCREGLRKLPDECINCVITSPPYWSLRDYGLEGSVWDGDPECEHDFSNETVLPSKHGKGFGGPKKMVSLNEDTISHFCVKCGAWKGCLGLEPTFELYLQHLVSIFDLVRKVLRNDGVMFINLGDTYIDKSLQLIPQRFAEMMCKRGWKLRNCIIWYKPNTMPSSAKDRFTIDHEYIYFFTKSKNRQIDIKRPLEKPLEKYEASWLAGIIDGEGTIGIRRTKNQSNNRHRDRFGAYLTMSNTSLALIKECQKITGVGRIKDSGSSTNFPVYRWECTHRSASAVIAEIYPYLIDKKEQAKVALALQKTNKRRGFQKETGHKIRLTDKEYEEKIRLFELVKSLNQKEVLESGLPEPNLKRYGGCEKYWFDQDAVREPHQGNSGRAKQRAKGIDNCTPYQTVGGGKWGKPNIDANPSGRNKRTVWTVPTKPNPEAHFATFNADLITPMIKAGCPKEVCTVCGKPRERITKTKSLERWELDHKDPNYRPSRYDKKYIKNKPQKYHKSKTLGWTDCGCGTKYDETANKAKDCSETIHTHRKLLKEIAKEKFPNSTSKQQKFYNQWKDDPTKITKPKTSTLSNCNHGNKWLPGIVLDPFMGSGTTALTAWKLGRDYLGFELNKEYMKIIERTLQPTKNMRLTKWIS